MTQKRKPAKFHFYEAEGAHQDGGFYLVSFDQTVHPRGWAVEPLHLYDLLTEEDRIFKPIRDEHGRIVDKKTTREHTVQEPDYDSKTDTQIGTFPVTHKMTEHEGPKRVYKGTSKEYDKNKWEWFVTQFRLHNVKANVRPSLAHWMAKHGLHWPKELLSKDTDDIDLNYLKIDGMPFISAFTWPLPRTVQYLFHKHWSAWSPRASSAAGLQPTYNKLWEDYEVLNAQHLKRLAKLERPAVLKEMPNPEKTTSDYRVKALKENNGVTKFSNGKIEILVPEDKIVRTLSKAQQRSADWFKKAIVVYEESTKDLLGKYNAEKNTVNKKQLIHQYESAKEEAEKAKTFLARVTKAAHGIYFPSDDAELRGLLTAGVPEGTRWMLFKASGPDKPLEIALEGFRGYFFQYEPSDRDWPQYPEFDIKV